MPHIVIDRLKEINYPVKVDDVEFLFKAQELIAVKSPNAKFLINVLK